MPNCHNGCPQKSLQKNPNFGTAAQKGDKMEGEEEEVGWRGRRMEGKKEGGNNGSSEIFTWKKGKQCVTFCFLYIL